MGRALLILLISWVYTGCATVQHRPPTRPGSPPAGPLRLLESGPWLDARVTLDAPGPGSADRIEFVPAGRDPARQIASGEVDLAVLYGRPAGELLDGAPPSVRLERLAAWDRVWALWLDASARRVNDPRFRRWLAGVIDREAMLRFLFDGRGAPAFGLAADDPFARAEWTRTGRAPFSPSSAPRLSLLLAGDDPQAASIGARIKAVLEQEGLEIRLAPTLRARFGDELASRRHALALVAHLPHSDDPLSALRRTLAPLGPAAGSEREQLSGAAHLSGREAREAAARTIEQRLLRDVRLVPLVRLDAWLALGLDVEGVEAGPYGVLRLVRARPVR